MKNSLKIFLIMILAFSSIKANAAVYSDVQIKNIVAKQVAAYYEKYTDAELKVEVVGLPFKDMSLPEGKATFVLVPTSERFMPRSLEKVSVSVNGKHVKNINVPVVIKAYQNVLVASCFINREEVITPQVVKVKKIEVSNTIGYQLKADALNKEILAKKAFMEGEIIDKRFVKSRPDVMRNAVVTVLFNTNNLTVSTEATALSDGVVGDNICTMSKSYNRIYTGRIVGENKVLVKL